MIAAVCLGFFGAILALLGMKCTKVGGSETSKTRLAVFAGFQYILSGKIYPPRLRVEFWSLIPI